MQASEIIPMLQRFDEQVTLPLLHEMNAEAVRNAQFSLTLLPYSIAFLANGYEDFRICRQHVYWESLNVWYCHAESTTRRVFTLGAVLDLETGVARPHSAEIHDVLTVQHSDGYTVWVNPIDEKEVLRIPFGDHHMINAWYLFRAAILPLMYQRRYREPANPVERVQMQARIIHQIRLAYQELV